jgi:hypothetical protein
VGCSPHHVCSHLQCLCKCACEMVCMLVCRAWFDTRIGDGLVERVLQVSR